MTRRRDCALALALLGCPEGGAPPPAAPAAEAEVVAFLDGEPITREEAGAAAAFRIYRSQVDVYSILEAETEKLVDERLLAREAERLGTTPEALLERAGAEAAPASDQEVERYLAEHPADHAVAPEEARARVRHYLEEKRRIQGRLALRERLRREAGYRWVLEPPEPPRTRIDVSGAPARGAPDAPLTLVHFATFGSRDSAQSARRLTRLMQEYPGAIRWVHRSFLMQRDETALLATRLGFVAQDAGRFWELHDRLFDSGGRLDAAGVEAAARGAGLTAADLAAARSDVALLDRVRRDIEVGRAAGLPRAPGLFVNGRHTSGLVPYEELRDIVEEELARARGG